MLIPLNCPTHSPLSPPLRVLGLSFCTPNGRKIEQSDGLMGRGIVDGGRKWKSGIRNISHSLSSPAKFSASQVKHAELANATRRRAAEERREGRRKEVSPFLTLLTFCAPTDTIIGERDSRDLLSCPGVAKHYNQGCFTIINFKNVCKQASHTENDQ